MTRKDFDSIPSLAPFNPLDKRNLGQSVFVALTQQPFVPMVDIKPFKGAGVYAVYYTGSDVLYKGIEPVYANQERPIYVGKAVPTGARKGNLGLDAEPGLVLYNRLKEHSESIIAADNLRIEDFRCRFLAVDDIWIPLAESLLITTYSPLWNVIIEGFGNHDPGKGRVNQQKSVWDVLHPGRTWATKLRDNNLTELVIRRKIQDWSVNQKRSLSSKVLEKDSTIGKQNSTE